MSKLFKSKFLLGVMVVAVLVVGFAVSATTASADCTIVNTLRVGSVGDEVKCLQGKVGATADGKFGPMTATSVKAFQSLKGLSPDGVVGAMTRAALMGAPTGNFPAGCTSASGYSSTTGVACNTGTSAGLPAGCSTTAGYSPLTGKKCDSSTPAPVGDLEGGFGTISAMTQLSQYSGEEVGAGSDDVKVAGFEVEASNDGDIQIQAIKLVFDSTGNASGDSDRLEDYLSSVSVLQGSTEVANVDVADFTKVSTGVYSHIVVLEDAIVRADDKEAFYITVSAVTNLDSADIDSDSWEVGIANLRVVDGSGVTTTDTSSIPAAMLMDNSNADTDGVAMSFVSFSTASDTELKLSANSTPAAATVAVETSSDTPDVELLKGKFTVEGDSDIWLDELPVLFTATGESVVATASNATLEIDGKTFNETVTAATSTATILFNDLDLTLEAGKSYNFTVSADINDIEDTGVATTDFDVGDTLKAEVTTTQRASIVAENEQGDALTDSTEMTGSAIGNAMTFRTEGVNVVMGTPTYSNISDTNGVVTQQMFTIPVAVTSFGNTLYMGQSGQFAAVATASNGFAVVFENSTTPTTADVTSSASIAISSTNALVSSNGYVLDEDQTKNFVIEVTQTTPGLLGAITAGNYRVRLDDIRVFTGAGLESTATATSIDLTPTSSYRTAFKYITS